MITRFLCVIGMLFSLFTQAQLGGRSTYQFLNTVTAPKLAALSGVANAHLDPSLEMAYFNPSLLDSNHVSQLDANYTDYLSDINFGFSAYAFKIKDYGVFMVGAKFVHYGDFIEANAGGEITGEFTASETAAFVSWSNDYKYNIRYGLSLKLVNSNFYQYSSFGVLLDGGANWTAKNTLTRVALNFKNLGSQITTYAGGYEPMPFEVQLGISKELEHAPFRFTLNAHNLQNPNFWYESPNDNTATNLFNEKEVESGTPWGEVALRHLSAGAELILSENFQLRMGYHHQRRSELTLRPDARSGAVGFSFGFGLKIKKFQLDYARSIYHLAGGTNHFGISIKLSEFTQKNTAVPSE